MIDISFLGKNKNIKELEIDSYWAKIYDYSFLSTLNQLESISLKYSKISDFSFMNKNIKKLKLIDCTNIKDFSFISYLENLECLYITTNTEYLFNFTDISFLEKTQNLRELNLSNCEYVKNFSYIKNLKKLEKLDLGRTYISDLSFLEKLQNIQELNLIFTNITDISFLEGTINIKELNLKGCYKIRDFSYIKNAEKLEVLILERLILMIFRS